MNTIIGFILGLFIGALMGLFFGAIAVKNKEFNTYEDGFDDGINFMQNKNKNFDNKERRQ